MTADRLTSLLKAARPGHRDRTPACPDEHQIAAYVDGTLTPERGEQLELHLADCDACLALVGILSRDRVPASLEPVPERTLERARRLARTARPAAKRYAQYVAAAAALVLSISVLLNVSQRTGDGLESPPPPDTRAVRKATIAPPSVQVLSPGAGVTVPASGLIVRWAAVPGTHYYEVRVVTDSGDIVVAERVTGTEWHPPGRLALHPGAEYFVHVDAFLSEARSVDSDHVPFSVAN